MNKHLRLAYMVSDLLDNKFNIIGLHFGVEPLLGLIPGVGDFIGLVLSFYLIWIAVQLKLPQDKIQKMVLNVIFDFVIGLFPVIGDVADFVFKANVRNAQILKKFAPDEILEGEAVR